MEARAGVEPTYTDLQSIYAKLTLYKSITYISILVRVIKRVIEIIENKDAIDYELNRTILI